MTAKVASPASPAEDLACRGPLKAKRLLYTEDQLSFTRKVSQTPTKQGHSVVCAAFIRLLMSPAFPLLRSCVFFFSPPFFTPALLFVSRRLSPSACFFPATARRLYLVYLLGPTRRSKPQLVANVATLRPRLTAPKQESGGTLDSLSYYLGRRPAMPLTLCHVACSHYKPSGSRGPPACILSVCVYTSALVLVRGSNPSFPTGFWKHFVHLLMFCVSASSPSRPRRSHFYLLSPLTAEGMTGSRRKRFVSS